MKKIFIIICCDILIVGSIFYYFVSDIQKAFNGFPFSGLASPGESSSFGKLGERSSPMEDFSYLHYESNQEIDQELKDQLKNSKIGGLYGQTLGKERDTTYTFQVVFESCKYRLPRFSTHFGGKSYLYFGCKKKSVKRTFTNEDSNQLCFQISRDEVPLVPLLPDCHKLIIPGGDLPTLGYNLSAHIFTAL